MVISIARQSVIIKCNLEKSIMTGNFEFYYAAGLLSKISGQPVEEGKTPEELKEEVDRILENFQSEDERVLHLMKMLRYYKPLEEKTEQMDELFRLGTGETHMWQENMF